MGFPDAKDLNVKIHGGASDSAHFSVDLQFQSEAAPLEPALAASLAKAADESRGLAMDGVKQANSGHLGLPLGAAEIGAVLFGSKMSYNPDDPHGLIATASSCRRVMAPCSYSWLHMAGYALPR